MGISAIQPAIEGSVIGRGYVHRPRFTLFGE